MAVAKINGQIISWALRRLGADIESIATPKLSVAKLRSWESGKASPSEGDATRLAESLGIAYPMLFMADVPHEELVKVPDLRTLNGEDIARPSLNLLNTIDLTKARQAWYKSELQEASAKPLRFVGRYGIDDDPVEVAQDMRDTLGIHADIRESASNYEAFLKVLIEAAEDSGVLTMRSAIAGHATQRVLSVSEFRGFVLIDKIAPLIFINDSDAKAAQIFTFAHEMAHLWLGVSGISDRQPNDKGSRNKIEIACDGIAAEFLVPENEFKAVWKAKVTLDGNMIATARQFRVSTLVVLRRAHDLNLVGSKEFFAKVEQQYAGYKAKEDEKKKGKDKGEKKGGNFWSSFELRNGAKFNAAVVDSIRGQRLTYTEAASLFAISPAAAGRYVQRVSVKH
jgi:Zn-dependent peptidase ImmA (M78 family)